MYHNNITISIYLVFFEACSTIKVQSLSQVQEAGLKVGQSSHVVNFQVMSFALPADSGMCGSYCVFSAIDISIVPGSS